MIASNSTIRFSDNGMIRELAGSVMNLRKENNEEVLYTSCGSRIALRDILAFNGIQFS